MRKRLSIGRKFSESMLRGFVVVVVLALIAFEGMLPTDNGVVSVILEEFVTQSRALHSASHHFFKTQDVATNKSFCVPWTQNSDEWWTHHVEWEMDLDRDNDTHYCFKRIENTRKLGALTELYQIQFHGNCDDLLTKKMWSSGWNADMLNVMDGLRHAVLHRRPFQLADMPWHYANPKLAKPGIKAYKDIKPVCKAGNQFCYFLPISNCPAAPVYHPKDILEEQFVGTHLYQWYYEYVTRRQTWLRKAVYDFSKKQQSIQAPCTNLHVRRGDVIIHPGEHKRKYHPIRDYLNESFHVHRNIFLMTDDANAIAEAKTEFPQYNWMYVDRPRFKAAEGGFENQLPTRDPIHEVVVILTVFQMARTCSQLIHSYSTFATQIYSEMMATGYPVSRIQIDRGAEVFSPTHGSTFGVSKSYEHSDRKVTPIATDVKITQKKIQEEKLGRLSIPGVKHRRKRWPLKGGKKFRKEIV